MQDHIAALLDTLADLGQTFENPRASIRSPMVETVAGSAMQTLQELGPRSSRALRFGNLLGEGGMGVVHLAEQRSVGRHIAVKHLPDRQRDNEVATTALLREGLVLAALEHPNIPPVYDLTLDEDGSPLVLLKRIEGEDWDQLMHREETVRERFGETLLAWNLDILDQVCNALKYAHSRGIVHRDLKPANVKLGRFGEVYLLDWGLAVTLEKDPRGHLPYVGDSLQPAGTPYYMAPELLFQDTSQVGVHTDVYLLGACLYEILTGNPPHVGRDMPTIIRSIMSSQRSFPEEVPTALIDICDKAMNIDIDARHPNVEEFQHELRHFQRKRASQILAEQAMQWLSKLKALSTQPYTNATSAEMSGLYPECRFGFRHALTLAEDNQEAIDALREATELMTRHSLANGQLDAARAFHGELRDPPQELTNELNAAIRARDEQSRERAQRDEALRELQEANLQSDMRIGQRARGLVLISLALSWWATMLILGALQRRGFIEVTCAKLFLGQSAVLLGLGTASFVARKALLKNAASRAIMFGLFGAVTGNLIVFAFGVTLPLSVPAAFALCHVLMWVAVVTVMPYDRRFLSGALILPIGAAIPWVPNFALEINGSVVLLTMLAISWSMRGSEPEK